jgi:branched-chain amino acid transport system substrate-binding protein
MNVVRFRCWLIITLVLALIFPLPSLSRAAEPYEIHVIIPLTGFGAFLGQNEAKALGMLEKHVNASGGVRGRAIKFVIADDQSNPQVAVQLLNALKAKHVPIVLGSTLAAMCSAMAPLVEEGPVDFCFSSAIHPSKGSYVFSGNLSTFDLMGTMVRYFRERGWKKLALIVTTDASGQDGEKALDDSLAAPANKDLSVVSRERFNPSDLSIDAQITRVKAAGAQAVIVYAAGTPLGTVFHSVQNVGLELPMGTTSANLSYDAMKQYAGILPKELYFTAPPGVAYESLPAGPLRSTVKTFVDAAKEANLHVDIPLIAAWDPGLIALAAFNKLGFEATAAQIHDFIENLHDFPGDYGIYDFRDGSQRGLAPNNGIEVRWDAAKDYWVAVSKFGGAL